MRRSFYLSPAFSGGSELDAIRSAYDPLASKIAPHITLVFPFESSLGVEALAAHAEEAVVSVVCFWITLGRPQTRGDYVWLPVVQGRDQVVALHDALYRGPLGDHLDPARSYEPHLTIAQVRGDHIERVHRAALALRGPFEARVDRVFIETILPDESSKIERKVGLKKNGKHTGPAGSKLS